MTFHQDIGFQPPPPPNPGSILPTIQSMREIQGQNALGAAYQQAVDPTTGRIDQAKLANALTTSNAPWMVGPGGIQAGQSMQAQGQGTTAQMEAQRQQLQFFNSTLAGIDLSVPHYAPELQTKLDMLNKSGYITPEAYAQGAQMLKTLGPNEPANDLIRSMRYMGQSAEEFANRNLPPTVGQQSQIQQWLAQPYTWNDANGQPKQGTYGQFLQERGIPAPSFFPSGAAGGTTAATAPGGPAPSSVTTGRGPVTSGGASAATPAPPAKGAGSPVGANVPVGTPAEVLPGPVVAGGQTAYQQDQALKGSLGNRIAPLENVLSTLHANPDLQTAGVGGLNSLEQVGRSFGMPAGTITSAGDAYQELGKYLAQYARQLPGAERSDIAQLQAQSASPHLEQGRQAIAVLAAKAIGYERMRTAPVDYFNSQYPDIATAARNSGRYQLETADWAKKQDPVAYAIDEMDGNMVGQYVAGLSSSARARFVASAADAQRLYGIDVGTSVGPAPAVAPATAAAPPAANIPPAPATPLPPSYPPGYTGG